MTTPTLLDLPAGYYAVPDPDDPAVLTCWRWSTTGTARGLRRFSGGAAYGEPTRPSRGSPHTNTLLARLSYRDWLRVVLAAVRSDPEAAAVRFAETTGRCRCCGRRLTDPRSVSTLGIGPECRRESR